MNNKVVHTLFKSVLELEFITVNFNFRGVERSEGPLYSGNDDGMGEVEDVVAVAEAVAAEYASRFDSPPPLCLAGFSFGGAIQIFAAQRLKPRQVVLVAPAVERLNAPPLSFPQEAQDVRSLSRVLIIHGDQDDVVPLKTVLDWAAPQELPIVVVPGAGHFFHRRLHILKRIVLDSCRL
jgi:alpha/beta superfamily hydrolase